MLKIIYEYNYKVFKILLFLYLDIEYCLENNECIKKYINSR